LDLRTGILGGRRENYSAGGRRDHIRGEDTATHHVLKIKKNEVESSVGFRLLDGFEAIKGRDDVGISEP